jgi:prenyltransferase beta subunit
MNSGPGSIRDSTGNADDMVHRMLGLTGLKYQDFNHDAQSLPIDSTKRMKWIT